MRNKYICMWCDPDMVFQYQEFAYDVDLKEWFHVIVKNGFYNLTIYNVEVKKSEN